MYEHIHNGETLPKKKWRKKILEACITNQRLQKIKEKKEVDTYLYLQKI